MTVALRDRRKRDWFWGEKSAIARLENDRQVAVYVALLVLSGEGSLIWASQDTVSSVAHVSVSSVGRTLPELERLGVLRRADDETLARLAERLREVPGTNVYELTNVVETEEDKPKPQLDDDRPLLDRVAELAGLEGVERKKRFVAILVKWLRQQTGQEIQYPWAIKLYERVNGDEQKLMAAAQATVKARPQGSVLGYMTKVLGSLRTLDPIVEAHVHQDTADAFGGF